MPIMPSTQTQSFFGKVLSTLSGLLRGSPPIIDIGSSKTSPQIMADLVDSGVADLRKTLKKARRSAKKGHPVGGRDYTCCRIYIYWENGNWRVRVKGVQVGHYRTLASAVTARNAYCRKHNITLKRGQ